MKKVIVFTLLLLGVVGNAQKKEVQEVIDNFFVAFHQKDTIKLKLICSDKLILQSISESAEKGGKLSEESVKEFYKSIAAISSTVKFKEKILSSFIQIDGTMAHVWAPYEFYFNDKLSHSGVNAFTLFKEKDKWQIIYLIDTRRK